MPRAGHKNAASGGMATIQRNGCPHQFQKSLLVECIGLGQIDGAADLAIQAGIEQPVRVAQARALCKSELHFVFVCFAGANDSVV